MIYNQLLARNFTRENISLYTYDGIATDLRNPYIGQVFHSISHKLNAYPGSESINFKSDSVTRIILWIYHQTTDNLRRLFIYLS